MDDYGPVGTGTSRSHIVLAENGEKYIIKGPQLNPRAPYIAANELIAATLAGVLSLPMMDYTIIEMAGHFYFGSRWMDTDSFYPVITAELLQRCENRQRVYDVVVFDTWLCNTDRHDENLIVRRVDSKHLVMLNDHSHCLVGEGEDTRRLSSLTPSLPERYVTLPFVQQAIIEASKLQATVRAVEQLSDGIIRDAVQSAPDELLSTADRNTIQNFVLTRRDNLRDRFINGWGYFYKLDTEFE